MASLRSQSSKDEEFDFLFRRPSAIRASQFEEAILAIASSMSEAEFTTSVCQGIHATLQNVSKAKTLLFAHDDLKYSASNDMFKELPKSGILWKVIRQRSLEVMKSIPTDDPICEILDISSQSIEDRIVLVQPITNYNEMRVVALMIAVCDEPNAQLREKLEWLSKNVEVAADRVLKQVKKEDDKSRVEGMLKVCGSLVDLDVNLLLLKIQTHLKQLLKCAVSVLFIVDEDNSELICEVFDESPLDIEIRIAVSECVYGRCVLSDEIVHINNVSEDARINPNTDFINNYEPKNMLCMPMRSRRNSLDTISVIGVAVAFDKKNGFTTQDQENMLFVIKFCSTMLANTLQFRHEIAVKHQNQALLNVARNLFTRLNDSDVLLHSIMEEARNLTKAERCSLFLVEKETQELVAVVFDSELPETGVPLRIPLGQGIAGYVAQSGKTVNIRDAYKHPQFYKEIDKSTGFVTRNILCVPIIDHTGVVGVAQLVNKEGGRFFTNYDEELAKSFSVYCGISIYHSMLYNSVLMEQSRSQLSTELMIYHMQVHNDDVVLLAKTTVPSTDSFHSHISEFLFSPRCIPDNDTPLAVISMMKEMGLIQRWKIPRKTLAKFVIMVKKGYRNPPYHNWMHAFSVTHFCYTLYKNCNGLRLLSELELLALFVSCLCHDIDHRGTNNAFQVSSNSVLASLYSSQGSVLERHHFSQTMCILNSKGCNLFENLTSDEYRETLDLIHDIILATDIGTHLKIVKELEHMAENGFNPSEPRHHHLLRSLLMTSCDLSACLKDWESTVAVSKLIYTEFFSQGDQEKAIGVVPSVMMDRDKAILTEQQLGFLDKIAMPVYKLLSQVIPETFSAYDNLLVNHDNWLKWKEEGKSL